MSRLRSITLTVYLHVGLSTWESQVLELLASSQLEQFHISTAGGHVGPALSDTFCASLVATHGVRLTRFSVQRMQMSLQAIELICRSCSELQQLFVVVEQRSLVSPIVSRSNTMQALTDLSGGIRALFISGTESACRSYQPPIESCLLGVPGSSSPRETIINRQTMWPTTDAIWL